MQVPVRPGPQRLEGVERQRVPRDRRGEARGAGLDGAAVGGEDRRRGAAVLDPDAVVAARALLGGEFGEAPVAVGQGPSPSGGAQTSSRDTVFEIRPSRRSSATISPKAISSQRSPSSVSGSEAKMAEVASPSGQASTS